jgi:hypothetical protein
MVATQTWSPWISLFSAAWGSGVEIHGFVSTPRGGLPLSRATLERPRQPETWNHGRRRRYLEDGDRLQNRSAVRRRTIR